MNHAQKIDRLLEIHGWTLRELARRTGFGRERIRRMAMKMPDSVRCAIKIAQALNVPAEWLFDDNLDWAAKQSALPYSHSSAAEDIDLHSLQRELRKLLGIKQYTHES